jgi:hypothetical protein
MSANFLDALNAKVSDIERPALLPVGTYVWKINKPHKENQPGQSGWASIDFPCVPVSAYEPAEDIDMDELSAYGSLNNGISSIRFMLDTNADGKVAIEKFQWALRRFCLDTLKVEADEDSTLKELMAKAVGCEFIATASHRQAPGTEDVYCDVRNWAPVD